MSRRSDIEPGVIVVRTLDDSFSMRVNRRVLAACGMMFLVALFFVVLSLTSGDFGMPLSDVIGVVTGRGDDMARMIVLEWRLPRALLAFTLGAALAVSGAIFQSLTRNPLGSPDIIGFSVGAHTGALVAMLVLSGGYYETAAGALIGGMATSVAVYLLTYRQGSEGFRLIIVGIGVAAMLAAVNVWMIRRAELQLAMSAAIWAAGSLNGLGIDRLVPVCFALVLLMPAAFALSRPMRQMEMGDAVAMASGVPVNRIRLALAIVGVALVAIVVAAAGPIAFVALAAPQLARRLTRSAGTELMPSALMGGLLLIAADWAAQHALGVQIPVGVMTFNIGGFYFLWLLVREGRK